MNAHLVGDRLNGKVYQLTPNAQTDDGASILRERIKPYTYCHQTAEPFLFSAPVRF